MWIRFVGGPWHNHLIEITEDTFCVDAPGGIGDLRVVEPLEPIRHGFVIERYHRKLFCTKGGTEFRQMIHESMLVNGVPRDETYNESFYHAILLFSEHCRKGKGLLSDASSCD